MRGTNRVSCATGPQKDVERHGCAADLIYLHLRVHQSGTLLHDIAQGGNLKLSATHRAHHARRPGVLRRDQGARAVGQSQLSTRSARSKYGVVDLRFE